MKKALKIYLPFASNEIKRLLAYKASFYLFIVISLLGSFVSYYLWMAIYGSSESGIIGGLTKDEMVVYIFMIYVTTSILGVSISEWISDDVTKGTIAMNLIKPIDYRLSLIVRACGTVVYNFFVPSVFVWIGLEIYRVFALHMKPTSPLTILVYLVSCILSFLIYVLFDFCFGMVSFSTTYIFGLILVKDALMSFLTGHLIPISLFPKVLQDIFDFLPFSSMAYTPVMIYIGKYTGKTLCFMLLRQVIWVVILYLLGSFSWNKIKRRLNVLGG